MSAGGVEVGSKWLSAKISGPSDAPERMTLIREQDVGTVNSPVDGWA